LHAPEDSNTDPEAQLTVLCVEDDRMNLLLNQKALERVPGTQVRIARDGRTAFDMIRELAPDLVISDMRLPGMSGRELIRAVNKAGLAPHTTWIAISADSRSETRDAALRDGFSAYWVKPVNVRELMTTIKGLVALPRGDTDTRSTGGLDEAT
jgi:CheY-like chemotaxis protein